MFLTQTSIIIIKAALSCEVSGERGTRSTRPQTLQMHYQTLFTHSLLRDLCRAKAAAVLVRDALFCCLNKVYNYPQSAQIFLRSSQHPVPLLIYLSLFSTPKLPYAGRRSGCVQQGLSGEGVLVKWYSLIDGVGMRPCV